MRNAIRATAEINAALAEMSNCFERPPLFSSTSEPRPTSADVPGPPGDAGRGGKVSMEGQSDPVSSLFLPNHSRKGKGPFFPTGRDDGWPIQCTVTEILSERETAEAVCFQLNCHFPSLVRTSRAPMFCFVSDWRAFTGQY
jgi:hypothetical protein